MKLTWYAKLMLGLIIATLWTQLIYIHSLQHEIDFYEELLIEHGIHDHVNNHDFAPLNPAP